MNIRPNRKLNIHMHFLAALVGFALIANPAMAADEEWRPPPPMPDKYDWIQTTSLEWIKGKIIVMYDDKLEFDSKEFDEQTLDWKDVKELRSGNTMQIGFENGTIAVGKLFVDQKTIRVIGAEDQQFLRAGVLSITAGAPKERNYWAMKASLGANIRKGNSDQVENTAKMNVIRRTIKNRINIDLLSTFNRTNGETAADNQRVSAGWNHYISRRFFWTPVNGEWYRDPFKNIDQQWTLGMGLGYEIVNTPKIDWEVNGGLAYQTTRFVDVQDDEDDFANTPALVLGTNYDHELTKWMDFLFGYSFQIVNDESGTYTHHIETGLELELTSLLDFDITFIWDRIQNPRPDSDGVYPEQDDLQLVFFLGFDF